MRIGCSKSVEYSQETMEEALKKVGEMEANLGGTEILRPLKDIYSHACIPNQPRQVIHTPHTHVRQVVKIFFLYLCNLPFKPRVLLKQQSNKAFRELSG